MLFLLPTHLLVICSNKIIIIVIMSAGSSSNSNSNRSKLLLDRVTAAGLLNLTLSYLIRNKSEEWGWGARTMVIARAACSILFSVVMLDYVRVIYRYASSRTRNSNVGAPRLREQEGEGSATNPHHVKVRGFRDLPLHLIVNTPEFSYNGHQFGLKIYPGGDRHATEGYVSIYLTHLSEGSITVNCKLMIIDKFGNIKKVLQPERTFSFEGAGKGKITVGAGKGKVYRNFIKRSYILDESRNILDSDGTLTIAVSIKVPTDVSVPEAMIEALKANS